MNIDDLGRTNFELAPFTIPIVKKYLDECGPANFFGIRGNSYITPQSHSILPSITNKSLQQLATDMGLTVERRPVPVEEIAAFDEAAECGTAAVIAPISQTGPGLPSFAIT